MERAEEGLGRSQWRLVGYTGTLDDWVVDPDLFDYLKKNVCIYRRDEGGSWNSSVGGLHSGRHGAS
jgi:hypothetical protein